MKKIFKLEELDCAICGEKMEAKVKKIKGVKEVVISYMTQKMTIEIADELNFEEVMDEVVKVCHKVEPDCIIKR